MGLIRLCFYMCYFLYVNGSVMKIIPLDRIDIVHYNDFHARFEETSVQYNICKTNDTSCLGGFARLYQEIHTLLKDKPNALLLNAGDVFQGTYWYSLMKWNITQKFINMLPNDAHAIGNHEFDDGVEGLVPYLSSLRAPVVVANIDISKAPALKNLFQPHIILERNGRKIGIIGLITTETAASSRVQGIKFEDPVETARKEAQLLTDQGVNIIILLSHCGLNIDTKIAQTVGDNIDIIVGGHTHSLLWNSESPTKERVSGPYPVVVESETKPGHKVLVVTASAFTKYLGNMTAYFDKQGELHSFDGKPVFLNRSIPEDPFIKSQLQPYADELHSFVNEVVGFTDTDLLMEKCGFQECEIGDLIADAYLDAAKGVFEANLSHIAILTRNMIRGSIAKGDIVRGDIINTMPFTNKLMTAIIHGKYIIEALEFGLTNRWVTKPFNGPWLLQIAGGKAILNAETGKAESVALKEGNEYRTVEPEKEYQITALDFLINGGNNFTMFHNCRNRTYLGIDADLLEKYIKKISPIKPVLDNRLTVLN